MFRIPVISQLPTSRVRAVNENNEGEHGLIPPPPRLPFDFTQSYRISDNDILSVVRGRQTIPHMLTQNGINASFDDVTFLWSIMKGDPQNQIINPAGIFHDHIPNFIRSDGGLGLILAAANGQVKMVNYLIRHGAHINAQYDRALILAAINGKLPVVEYLIDHGANPHAQNDRALREGTPAVQAYLTEVIEQERHMRQHYRQAMGELRSLPPSEVFPGGTEYHAAYERFPRRRY